MNLNNILKKKSNNFINYKDLKNTNEVIERFDTSNDYHLKFNIPDGVDDSIAKQIVDDVNNTLTNKNIQPEDIHLLFKDGGTSLSNILQMRLKILKQNLLINVQEEKVKK